MFNIIRDFIAAYKQINKDRINAKARLDAIQCKLKEFKELYKSCQTIEGELGFVSKYCPDNQRKDFIQSTLDFFNYGVYVVVKSDGTRIYFGGNSYGWTKRIKYLVEYIGNVWTYCYDLYNDGKYEDVTKKYKVMNEYIDNELLGEQHSYENILKEYNKLTENNK